MRKIGGDLRSLGLHQQDRIHGNLKPQNILLVHAQSDDFTTFFSWKLIDFASLHCGWALWCQAALVRTARPR